jgi:hypothetical protein
MLLVYKSLSAVVPDYSFFSSHINLVFFSSNPISNSSKALPSDFTVLLTALFYNDFVFPEFHILFKEQFQVSCVQ